MMAENTTIYRGEVVCEDKIIFPGRIRDDGRKDPSRVPDAPMNQGDAR